MGGMADCGVGLDSKTSPRCAAIEKAQDDLRQEYDVREERRRELEFLEKGGNPLDFKFGNVASLSVQSTSLNVTSEAKGSFAFAPSPHGDSVESSGPNMADNLLLLDGDNSNAGTQVRSNNGNNNNAVGTKESEEPGILRFARRNRSRSNAGTRSSTLVSSKVEEKDEGKEKAKEKEEEKEKDKAKEKEKEKDKERERDELIVSNSVLASPKKSELALKTSQKPVEGSVMEDDNVKVVKVVTEEPDTERVIDTDMAISVEKAEGTGTAGEETNNTEIATPSIAPKGETASTGTNGLTENGETDTADGTRVTELDPKPAQLNPTGSVDSAVPVKDERREEEESKIEKSEKEINAAEGEMQLDGCVEKSKELDTVSEVAATQPTEEELKVAKKEHEDSVLKKARVIEVNLKKAGETPSSKLLLERRRKSQWDFLLEEMAWLANDFMQERLWKTAAASQMGRWIANGGRVKFEESNLRKRQRNVAWTLAKAVIKFWHSVDEERKQGENCMKEDNIESRRGPLGIRAYAVRVLEYNTGDVCEALSTPDRPCHTGVLLVLEQLPEECLFYSVPPGAMQAYRESIESQFAHLKKMGNSTHHEDCETSNSIADTRMENAYEEEEVQTGYVYDGGFSVRFNNKKRKHPDHHKAYTTKLHEPGSYEPYQDSKPPTQPPLSNGQRPVNNSPNILRIPTKRVRTNIQTGRKMVAGPSGLHPVMKMDASSDTNSYQQEGSLQQCDSFNKRNLEVESPVDFADRQMRGLPYDELALMPKKRKKQKQSYGEHYANEPHSSVGPSKNSLYEYRAQGDSALQYDQKDHLKKRMENHQFDSNSNNVVYGQQGARKPKMLNASAQEGGAVMMSPVASHSTMSNPKQLIKFVNSNRDRAATARKGKGIKLASGHSGPGSPWSNLEDQALVVLVHDMGPNWELISDAINSTLHFKRIYRRAKECKERHKFLMDKSAGDGADSAEDSGSSQPYPSTLPGIPKGSARQLFERLQGPLEEGTLKSHFEKIISLSLKLRTRNNQELKQITPAHNSHVIALSQVLPNNLGGNVLTPLDLCDAPSPSPEIPPIGYGGPHGNGPPLPGPHQGTIGAPMPPPSSNMGPVMQGSAGLVLAGSLPSPSTPLNVPIRDSQQRYGVPRGPALQADEQQRMQQHYNHMVSGRSLPIPGSVPGSGGMRMLPGGGCSNGMGGMVQGGSSLIRSMTPLPRPGFQRLNTPGMLNMVSPSAGNMISASGPGMQAGPMNPVMRPRDSLQMLRPGQNMDEHSRQMMMQELQLQQMPSQQGNNGGVQFPGPSNSSSSAIPPSTAASSPLQSFPPVQSLGGAPQAPHQQVFTNHPTPHQQAYAIRYAKQMQQQQQQRMNQSGQQPMTSAASPSPPVGVGVSPTQQQMVKNNLPEGSTPNLAPKKQKQNTQQRQNNQSTKGAPKGGSRGGSILMHQTLAAGGGNNQQPNKLYPVASSSPLVMAPLGSASRLGPPQPVDQAQLNQMSASDSGGDATQESTGGNEMLIGQGPGGAVLGPNQGIVGQRHGIGGAHWQSKNQVQNNSNNSNRSVVQGNVYAQPSNSGPG